MTRRARHLVRRFLGAIIPRGPRLSERAWVEEILSDGELALWRQLPRHDRRHSIAVARRVARALGSTPDADDPRWVAAALLHDVGKLDARLGVLGRVGATLAGLAAPDMAEVWSAKRGITRRVGLYLRHAELGEDRLRMVAARPEAQRWAGAHHRPDSADVGFPAHVVAALLEADDD